MRAALQRRVTKNGGARRDRTADLLRARQALSQLSYGPVTCLFSVWPRWLFAHLVMYAYVHSLARSQAALPTKKNPASRHLSSLQRISSLVRINPDFAPFCSDQGGVSRRIACYASGAPTPSWTKWWVWEDLNFRPHPYQGCALTN